MHPTRSRQTVKNHKWKQTYSKMIVTTVTTMHPTRSRQTVKNNLSKHYSQAFSRFMTSEKKNSKSWAVLDSGATSHLLVINTAANKVTPADNPLTVTILDGTALKSTHVRKLDLPQLPMTARLGHVIPGLVSQSLMSVVQLTDASYGVHFLKHCVAMTYNGRVVLEGARNSSSTLWMVRLTNEKPAAGPGSPSNVLFESANHVTTDQW